MPDVVGTLCLLVAAIIHLLPLQGVLGPRRLEALYGVPISQPELELAMRHRAVLFGLLGGLLILSIWLPGVAWVAVPITLMSDLSFLALALAIPGTGPAMRKVVIADMVSILALGVWIFMRSPT